MAKKRKPAPTAPRAARPKPLPETKPPSGGVERWRAFVVERLRHPMLVLGWVGLGFTLFAAGAAIRFRNDRSMGAIREPTGTIMAAAITVTAFASYWRQTRRNKQPPPGPPPAGSSTARDPAP